MKQIEGKTQDDPLKTFKKALENVKPVLEVKSRRVGGSTYQVPVEVKPNRRMSLAIRWIINYSQARGEKTMQDKLAGELLDFHCGDGVKGRAGLIHEQYLRLDRQCPGDAQALLLSAGQAGGR